MLDSWSVHLTLYRMTPCWTRDLCIWHNTEWRHVGLVICVSDIIQNDDGLVICVSAIIQNDNMLDSWSVYLTLYWMTPRWTRDLMLSFCIMADTQITSPRGVIQYNVRYTDHESNMASFCTMSDAQITSPTWHHSVQCQMHRSRVQHGIILYNVRYTDHESNMASFYKCQIHRSRVQHEAILYNVRYKDHESNMASFCKCQIHRSRVQHCVIMYNVRYTDHESNIILYNVRYIGHESNIASSCIMSDTDHESKCIRHYTEWCWTRDLCIWHYTEWCWTRDLCIWHYTEWSHVGLVICVSDIIQNDGMLDLWSVYLTLYRMMMDSWSVYLPLYRMTTCWTRDLCIWHYTEWRHVGLVICVSDIQNDSMLDLWSVYLTLYRMMMDSWSVYLPLYRMTTCWTRDLHHCDLCICHYTEWQHVGLVICVSDIIQNDVGLVICVSDIIQNGSMLDLWSVYLTLYRMASCWPCDRVSDIIQNDAMLD